MRLVFYPPQDNSDLWSMRSSGRQFCHSSCSWRHSRPRAPLESSSRIWILPRPGTPARCSKVQSCLSPTDRECGQTSPTRNISRNHPFLLEGFDTHRVTEDTTWPSRVSTLCWDYQDCEEGEGECLDVPDSRHLEPHSAGLSYVFSPFRLSSYNWSDSASVSLSRTNTSEMKNGGNKTWFPWLQDLYRVLSPPLWDGRWHHYISIVIIIPSLVTLKACQW